MSKAKLAFCATLSIRLLQIGIAIGQNPALRTAIRQLLLEPGILDGIEVKEKILGVNAISSWVGICPSCL
jgi:hypothetical protein